MLVIKRYDEVDKRQFSFLCRNKVLVLFSFVAQICMSSKSVYTMSFQVGIDFSLLKRKLLWYSNDEELDFAQLDEMKDWVCVYSG